MSGSRMPSSACNKKAKTESRMLAGVEEHRRVHRLAEAIQNLPIDRRVRLRLRVRDEVGDPERATWRLDHCAICNAVPHGRWWVVVDGAEVALTIDERVAQRERLRHA